MIWSKQIKKVPFSNFLVHKQNSCFYRNTYATLRSSDPALLNICQGQFVLYFTFMFASTQSSSFAFASTFWSQYQVLVKQYESISRYVIQAKQGPTHKNIASKHYYLAKLLGVLFKSEFLLWSELKRGTHIETLLHQPVSSRLNDILLLFHLIYNI